MVNTYNLQFLLYDLDSLTQISKSITVAFNVSYWYSEDNVLHAKKFSGKSACVEYEGRALCFLFE